MSAIKLSVDADQSVSTLIGQSANNLLEIDAETFRTNFNRRPFFVKHNLVDHPLFSLARLVDLSRKLPEEHVIYHSGDIAPQTALYKGGRTGLSSEETIKEIEEGRSWMGPRSLA